MQITVIAKYANKNRSKHIAPIKLWLKQNCERQTRTLACRSWDIKNGRIDQDIMRLTIFLENKSDYQKVLQQYSESVIRTLAPASQEHEELLSQGIKLDIRDHLYYHIYSYKITFKGIWYRGNNNKQIVKDFINNTLHDETKSKQDFKFLSLDYILYLKNIDDLMLVKMVLGELIREVIFAYTADQISNQTTLANETV